MNKKVLIISPFFPPSNTADMHRVRTSLPYFKEFGWDATVVAVDEHYTDATLDELLLLSVPSAIKVYKIKALNKKHTSKFGLGSLALRSLPYYIKQVNTLLKAEKFDLIYFSTTQFMICVLGAYWKKRYHIPYIIDLQDPWYTGHYQSQFKDQRPPKYLVAYTLHKYFEKKAMEHVSGLISVSESYTENLAKNYLHLKNIPASTITFGAFGPDLEVATENQEKFKPLLQPGGVNIVYIGRGGNDMHMAVKPLLAALSKDKSKSFSKLKLYFIGTSYAPKGQGKQTIFPLAQKFGVEKKVIELTDRIGHFHALTTLMQADALFIPGSDDPKYSASKIYPYLLTRKPVLAIFNSESPVIKIMQEYGVEDVYSYDADENIENEAAKFLKKISQKQIRPISYDKETIEKYSAKNMTKRQCEFFTFVLKQTYE